MIVRFLFESSQMRTRAYTVAPLNCTETIVSVGRLLVIFTGSIIGVSAEVAVAEPFALRAVTWMRNR